MDTDIILQRVWHLHRCVVLGLWLCRLTRCVGVLQGGKLLADEVLTEFTNIRAMYDLSLNSILTTQISNKPSLLYILRPLAWGALYQSCSRAHLSPRPRINRCKYTMGRNHNYLFATFRYVSQQTHAHFLQGNYARQAIQWRISGTSSYTFTVTSWTDVLEMI